MEHKKYQSWVSGIDELSLQQKEQAQDLLSGVTSENASLMAIEAQLAETRLCPHCNTAGAIAKGVKRGLRRYQCKTCNKTFNAATGTALQGLHNKGKWLIFGDFLANGLTVRKAAKHCNFAASTSFRWRHRFLAEYTTLAAMRRKCPSCFAANPPQTITFKPKQGRHYAMCRVPWFFGFTRP